MQNMKKNYPNMDSLLKIPLKVVGELLINFHSKNQDIIGFNLFVLKYQ